MKPRRAGLLLLALWAAACRRRSPPPPDPLVAVPWAPPGHEQVTALWLTPPDAPDTTALLDAQGNVTEQRPGAWVAHDGSLGMIVVEPLPEPGSPCPDGSRPFPERTLDRLVLRLPGADRTLLPRAPDSPAEEHHRLVALLGPYLFVRTDRVTHPCDDPPRYEARARLLELRGDSVLARSVEELLAEAGPPAGTARVTAAWPTLSPDGVSWTTQRTEAASWSGADGRWGSETRSSWSASPGIPARLDRVRTLPEPARSFLLRHPSARVGGVSAGAAGGPGGAASK